MDRIMLNKIRNFARQAKIKSASHNRPQASQGVFPFCLETPCSHFHGCAEGWLYSATMDEGKWGVLIISSVSSEKRDKVASKGP